MKNNAFGLTKEDNQKIANYDDGDALFYSQDLDVRNVIDGVQSIANGETAGIVSAQHSGIIGYVLKECADDITTVLNLHMIDREPQDDADKTFPKLKVRNLYIVTHPPSGLWQFVAAENESFAKEFAYHQRERDFLMMAIEEDISIKELKKELVVIKIGEENEDGLVIEKNDISLL